MPTGTHRFVLLLKTLVVLTIVYQLSLLLRPSYAFLSRPYIEDTFYAMSVARSIADGNGFTVDGIHPTNGVQPLVCLLNAPAFLVGDDHIGVSLRITWVLSVAVFLLAAFTIAGFVRSLYGRQREDANLVFWSVFGLVYVNYTIGIHYLNGLETALAGVLCFGALWYYAHLARDEGNTRGRTFGRHALLGVLLGLGVLARIDLSLLVVAVVAAHFIRAHVAYGKLPGAGRWRRFSRTVGEMFVTGFVAVVISSPWWIYNYTTFGSLMPVSGQSQQQLAEEVGVAAMETVNVLADAFLPGVHTPHSMRIGSFAPYGPIALALGLLLLSLLPGVRSGMRRGRERFADDWNPGRALPLGIFSLLLIAFYSFYFRAPHFQSRYLIVPGIAILLALFAFLYSLWKSLEPGSPARRVLPAILLAPMVLNFLFFSRNFESGYYNIMVNAVIWIDDNVRPGEKVGMFQSGTAGFAHPERVVNLDGKVNAAAWNAFSAGRLPQYADSMRFDYFIDWDSYMERIFIDPDLRSRYRGIDTLAAGLIVWERADRQPDE